MKLAGANSKRIAQESAERLRIFPPFVFSQLLSYSRKVLPVAVRKDEKHFPFELSLSPSEIERKVIDNGQRAHTLVFTYSDNAHF